MAAVDRPTHDADAFFSPDVFAAHGYPWAAWAELRRHDPVSWCEPTGHEPFWAVTRHADVVQVSKDPARFASGRGVTAIDSGAAGRGGMTPWRALRAALDAGIVRKPRLVRVLIEAIRSVRRQGTPEAVLRHLLTMDPPEHGAFRGLLTRRFTPRGLAPIYADVRRLADEAVAGCAERIADPARRTERFDFVEEVASFFPVAVIMHLLGAPREDWPQLVRWSNQVVGHHDAEYVGRSTPADTVLRAWLGLFDYFFELVARRRREPADDLVGALVAARIDGRPLSDFELLSYCFLLTLAGNETTRNASSGAMLAWIEHPAERERLRADPTLIDSAVEEVVRWTSPIIHFARTATREVELGGRRIAAGRRSCSSTPLRIATNASSSSPSASTSRAARTRTSASESASTSASARNLARLELRLLFDALLRLPPLERAGPVERLRSNFVGGVKHLPVRFGGA